MQKLHIPQTEWTPADGYVLMLLCCPKDAAWIGTVRGRIWELATGRLWDEQTGRVTDVQQIGREIWESMATCGFDDLVTALSTINVTIQAQQAVLENIVTTLGQIQAALEQAGAGEDLEDDLAAVWGTLESINTVLGGTNGPPPDPL